MRDGRFFGRSEGAAIRPALGIAQRVVDDNEHLSAQRAKRSPWANRWPVGPSRCCSRPLNQGVAPAWVNQGPLAQRLPHLTMRNYCARDGTRVRRLLTVKYPMSGTVGQVANLPGKIGNLPHDITFLRCNKRFEDDRLYPLLRPVTLAMEQKLG